MKNFIVENSILLYLMLPVYVLICRDLIKMGMDSHVQKVSGLKPEKYPQHYFFWLMVQIFLLAIAGLARNDTFIMATRFPQLLCVIICYVMVTNTTGMFEWKKYGAKITITIIAVFVFFVTYKQFPVISNWMEKYSNVFGYLATASMVAYFIFGEVTTIRECWVNFKKGKERMRGWHLLIFRFAGFALQSAHYEMKFGPTDPIFLLTTLGLFGTGTILVLYAKTPKEVFLLI